MVKDARAAYDPSQTKDPLQTKGVLRVLRGGGWGSLNPRWVRAASRGVIGLGHRYTNVGFRCARGQNQ
ncbi:MAG: hypothetical protein IPK82_22700 [Polyangiaceae bacterium]|nr:hypothetical protein [Polyangiaceae bacterium]